MICKFNENLNNDYTTQTIRLDKYIFDYKTFKIVLLSDPIKVTQSYENIALVYNDRQVVNIDNSYEAKIKLKKGAYNGETLLLQNGMKNIKITCKDESTEVICTLNTDKLNEKMFSRFSANFRQNNWDEPAKTVLSSIQSALLYPEPFLNIKDYVDAHAKRGDINFPRRLSVREHLRLQTVGDDFYFPDDISLHEQYNRCSGVPSLIAYKYGIAIADCLLGRTELRKHTLKKKTLF